jgi:hypothetical protein
LKKRFVRLVRLMRANLPPTSILKEWSARFAVPAARGVSAPECEATYAVSAVARNAR